MKINMSLHPEFEQLYKDFAQTHNHFLEIDGIDPSRMDLGNMSYKFFNETLANIAIDANSNLTGTINPTTYRTFCTDGIFKLFGFHLLWYYANKRYGLEFANRAIKMIWEGDLYCHDAHGVKMQMPYCYAFSLDKLVLEGRPYGRMHNDPPKHRKSFLSQVDKFISDLSKQFAGATAPSDFFVWYAYFCQKEGLDLDNDKHVAMIIQDLQGLTCLFNEPSRAEGESPFVNIALYDMPALENLFGHTVYPNFKNADLNYIMKLQLIFADWFSQGDPSTGFPYSFPVSTFNLTTDKHHRFIDPDFALNTVARLNCRMGTFNLHFGDKSKVAMCCRYENDLEDMGFTPDSFGNGGVNIGSHKIISINFPRVGYMAQGDVDTIYRLLDDRFDVASKLLIIHREDILKKRIEESPEYLQFFGKLGWFSLDTMFSTFGIVGINEVCEYMGYDINDDEDGTDFALDLVTYISDKVKYYRKKHGITFNAEEIPGEQTCVTLVNKDKLKFGEENIPYDLYSNQYIPLTSDIDTLTRLDLSGRFMSKIKGGGIVHCNIDHKIDNPSKMFELMKFASYAKVPHMAVCHRFGRCEDHKAQIVGQAKNCPVCGKPIIQAKARVIGYFSDENDWNEVRRTQDAPNRIYK